jgi:hypothetical protein
MASAGSRRGAPSRAGRDMRHAHRALAAAAITAAACGGNGGNGGNDQAFYREHEAAQQQLTELSAAAGTDLTHVLDDLAAVDPPDEIADDYRQVLAAYEAVAATGSITDPAVAGRLADAQAAATEIDEFVAQRCGSRG